MVDKAREYIRQGEVIQVVLSQRFAAPAVSSPLQIYRALRLINPSPYTFFLKLGGLVLAGSSPETMVPSGRTVTVRAALVVAWSGRLLPRALLASEAPGGAHGLAAFSGEGMVLLDGRG